jgi:uncharacterized protein YkwD
MKKRVYIFLCFAMIMVSVPFSGGAEAEEAKGEPFTDISGHWGVNAILWGIGQGVVNGFPDGTFQPNGNVTEAQFTAMLFRAFPDAAPPQTAPYWFSAYYALAKAWNWPVTTENPNASITRGQVAQMIAASQGHSLSLNDAVAYVLQHGFAQGRRAGNGSIDFGAGAMVTRAEAVQFVRNATAAGESIGPAEPPQASNTVKSDAPLNVSGITIGDSKQRVLEVLGEPARKDASEYGFTWYVYNDDDASFALVGIKADKVVGLYANGSTLSLRGIGKNAKAIEVSKQMGTPLTEIRKGNIRYLMNGNGEYDVFESGNAYITVFYDVHENGVITSAQAIEKSTELALLGFYGKPSANLKASFERVSLDLANSARVKRGLPALAWDDGASGTARGHSEDMAANGFFDHTNLQGEGLGDRLTGDNVSFRAAGENIAYGQTSAVFAHEGWMNSAGHRRNLLGDFELLGVGVAFTDSGVPYYTQNFLNR